MHCILVVSVYGESGFYAKLVWFQSTMVYFGLQFLGLKLPIVGDCLTVSSSEFQFLSVAGRNEL